ncbi:MAG: DNA-directed RNA polymerase subunit D [Candidatus Pacearchaeota archaeon]
MEKIDKSEDQIVFNANIEETIANSIRRYVNQIEVLAVDEVEIKKNDSALYDEAVAHRIGLIPLKRKKSALKSGGTLNLSVKGEKTVYSGDFEGDFTIVYDKIPITLLNAGQEVKLTGEVKAGKGVEHSKFSPGVMFYREISELTLDKNLLEEIKIACPEANIKEKGDKIIVLDDQKKEVADACEGIASRNRKKVDIEKKDGLIITVESFGQMSPEEIFVEAISVLKDDLESLTKEIKKA